MTIRSHAFCGRPHARPILWAALAGALSLAACSSVPNPNASLDDAHRAYQSAAGSPIVSRYAQGELARASMALNRADSVWRDGGKQDEVDHLAYLAEQRVQIARNMAAQREARRHVDQASAERARLLAELHAQRAETAQAAANQARQNAEFAQTQAQNAQARAAEQARRANQLQQELSALAARRTDEGLVVMLQDVLFDVGRASLLPGAASRLDRLAAVMREHPERRVKVEGFTDNTGSPASNLELSRERAESVKEALIARGVASDRIDVQGYGETLPVASNQTAAGRQQNRRVEVVFSDSNGDFASAR